MRAAFRSLLLLALATGTGQVAGQTLVYLEPGVAACPPVPATAAPRTVARGVAVPGRLSVSCGLDQGSYTVTLNATDPGAVFSPRTFLVNFGRVVGSGRFVVSFATPGAQRVWASVTSNMGSPAVQGRFASADGEFDVVPP